MKNKKSKTSFTYLIIAAFIAFSTYGYFPHNQIHPLYTILSLLPLQLGALIWIYLNGYFKEVNNNFWNLNYKSQNKRQKIISTLMWFSVG